MIYKKALKPYNIFLLLFWFFYNFDNR